MTLRADEPSLAILDLSPDCFPRAVHTGTLVGAIRKDALPGVALAPDAAAYVGGHDQVMALYSQSGGSPSEGFDSIGTSEYLMVLTDTFNGNEESWRLGLDIERGWGNADYLYGFATPSGKVIQLLADLFHRGDYDELLDAVDSAPVADPGFEVRISDFSAAASGLLDLVGVPASASAASVSRSVLDHLAHRALSALERMAAIAQTTVGEATLIGSLFQYPRMVAHRREVWDIPLRVSDLAEPVATGAALVARDSHVAASASGEARS
jgi:sugar (pentulose or hexulose) kinase